MTKRGRKRRGKDRCVKLLMEFFFNFVAIRKQLFYVKNNGNFNEASSFKSIGRKCNFLTLLCHRILPRT